MNAATGGDFAHVATDQIIRYSQVWEDHLLLEEGLALAPGDHVLSICSAGDNALALLAAGAGRVTAVDLNPAQTALLELKLAALARLDHRELAALVGATPHEDRLALYARVRDALPAAARAFWDGRAADLAAGVMGCGRLERYLRGFAPFRAPAAEALLAAPDLAAQGRAFAELATPGFEAAFRAYFNRDTMAERGRDPSQFRFVARDETASHFWERFRFACTEIPAAGNFSLEWILDGRLRDLAAGPPYLRPEAHARLAARAHRVEVVTADLGEFLAAQPAATFDKANLSDMFEYLSEDASAALLAELARTVRPGGRLAYWNLLVPRESPAALRDRLRPLPELARALWRRDRAFFYGAFRVEEVLQ